MATLPSKPGGNERQNIPKGDFALREKREHPYVDAVNVRHAGPTLRST
ncbi:hypothetical protein CHKEEEPN_2795 [Methylorubrum podarium]|nr:hypothetical protein CHKEEEPN_2795 [Methylorubrum podarium]